MENSQARLRILFPPGVDRTVPIDRDPFLIGHGSGADLILESDDRSPISASICREGLSYVLEDRGTAFGISVNGIPSVSRVLSNRDTITLGRDRRLEVVFLKDDPMSRILRRVDSCSRVGVSPAHYRNLALLLEICNGLNSMTSLQDILELALDAVIDVTCADRGS